MFAAEYEPTTKMAKGGEVAPEEDDDSGGFCVHCGSLLPDAMDAATEDAPEEEETEESAPPDKAGFLAALKKQRKS